MSTIDIQTAINFILLDINTMDFLSPKVARVKGKDVKNFHEKKLNSLQSIPAADVRYRKEQEKIVMAAYRTLCQPIDNFLNEIVTKTGLKLKEVIWTYWFKTPEWDYITQEFDTFDVEKGNRKVDPWHAAELIDEFQNKGYRYNKGLVNEKWGVINGQNRLLWLSYLKEEMNQVHPFIFDILPGGDVTDIETQNTAIDEWNWEDRLESGIDMGLPTYKKLAEMFYNKYEQRFPLSEIVNIANGWVSTTKSEFNEKKLEISAAKFAKAEEFIDSIFELYHAIYDNKEEAENTKEKNPKAYKKISAARAAIAIKLLNTPQFKRDRLLHAVKSSDNSWRSELRSMDTQNTALVCKNLIIAYNHKVPERNRIQVTDWKTLKRISGWYSTLDLINFS